MDPLKIAEHVSQSDSLQNLSPPVQTALFLGAMTLLPAALVTLTAFTRIVIVLGFVRRAVTTQEIPPNLVIIGLSLFLTLFVMGPTLDQIGTQAVEPYMDGKVNGVTAVCRGIEPLHDFMVRQTRRNDLALFLHLAKVSPPPAEPKDVPMRVLIPAFIISELKTAFIMGFCIYLPFLLVDLVVASVLTALGIITMPPVIISAPFKILLFVLADGWHLVVRALSMSFQ
jgi:flagellar biosynthetic protein FliP